MTSLLDYEKSILLDVNGGNCMFVCSEGLDLDNIIYILIKLHNDPHNLVLVSNYSNDEAKFISTKLISENEAYTPFLITAEINAKERLSAYRRGGIVFVSSRILVVDLLRGTMPVDLVTGVLVLRFHNLHEASQESFMLRLLREKNPQIFIKTFSDNAVALMSGYNRVEHLMNQFGVPRLLLWPRFNLEVVSTLSNCPMTVEEVQVFLTEETVTCQRCLLEMIKATLRELVEQNPILNNDEFSLESALTNSFHQLTSLYIDPVWHQLTQTSHRLLADVAGLRRILFQLIDNDAVGFLDELEELRQTELSALRTGKPVHISALQRRGTCANWLLMSQAEELLTVSRKRVYKDYGKRTYAVEVPPKLNAILSVLNEILSKAESDFPDQNRPVLVLVRHKRTVELIKYYLSHGKSKLRDWLVRGRMAYEHPPDLPVEESPPPKKPVASTSHRSTRSHTSRVFSKRVGGRQVISCRGIPDPAGEGFMPSTCDGHPALSGTVEKPSSPKVEASPKAESPDDEDEAVPVPDLPAGCFSFFFTNKEGKRLPIVLRVPPPGSREEGAPSAVDSHNLDGPAGRLAVLLSRLRPQYIVLFEPQVAWVREIEVFSAREFKRRTTEDQTPSPVGIYFMIYKDSVEEQRYLTRLRREKEAFETLISLRSSVVVQKTEPPPPADPSRVEKESTIFVDVREFRSELPALLHRKGVRVNPITLTMGDYILAPHICVERKSVSDLIGSLNSGRLYQQCTAMSRHYLNPVLLIEFSMPANGLTYQRSRFSPTPQGSFALFTGRNAVVSADAQVDLGARNLMSKLVLLIIHFPNLRVLWSVTPYCTAELFTELKLGRSEPTLDQLPHEGENLGDDNVEAVDMLLKMPGISWRNYRRVIAKVGSIAELVDLDLDSLVEILDNRECAKKLYDFLHCLWVPPSSSETASLVAEARPDTKRPRLALATRVKSRGNRGRGRGGST